METGNKGPSDGHIVQDRFLRQPEVIERVGVSWMTLRRWEREGRFPKRCKIGPRIVAWRESDINNFLANGGASDVKGKV